MTGAKPEKTAMIAIDKNMAKSIEKSHQETKDILLDKIRSCRWSLGIRDEEKFERLKENLRLHGQISQVRVRPIKDDMYEPWKGNLTYLAAKAIGWPTIKCIIDEISEKEALQRRISAHTTRSDYAHIELEKMVSKLKEISKDKKNVSLSKVTGLTPEWVSNLIKMEKFRKELAVFFKEESELSLDRASTRTLVDAKGLITEETGKSEGLKDVAKLVKLVLKGTYKPTQVRSIVKDLNTWTKGEKRRVLDGETSYWDAKLYFEKLHPKKIKILDKAKDKLNEEKALRDAVKKEKTVFNPESFQNLLDFIKKFDPTFIDRIPDETERKQADMDETHGFALYSHYMLKRKKISFDHYKDILDDLQISHEFVEDLKEDGQNISLLMDLKTPSEEKLDEKLRKLDTGRKDPLDQVVP